MKIDLAAISDQYFVVSGTLHRNAPSYVERKADQELFHALLNGDFCYVLTSRQMGKSSLINRAAARLEKEGISVAVLDLTALGKNLTAEQWYGGLLVQAGQRLNLEEELLQFWLLHLHIGPMQRWIKALREVVLHRIPGRLAIFIDEVDAVRSLPFSTDELFAGIRECYNQRNEDPEMGRLIFCLAGVVTPADLIRDTRTTPFNIGRRVELKDFTESESLSLAQGFACDHKTAITLLKRIHFWTGGHPYLTQRLCLTISSHLDTFRNPDGRAVDQLCEELFLSHRAQASDSNLFFVREQMLNCDGNLTDLLSLYERVLNRHHVPDDDLTPQVSTLRLSGITRSEKGRLKVRNRIYTLVFDQGWVSENMPDAEIRRQEEAYRRGIRRTSIIAFLVLAVVGTLAVTTIVQRNRALEQAAVNRRLLYFAQMKNAQQEWENGNVDRIEELLESQVPAPGERDLRGFEWHLFYQLTHKDLFRLRENSQIASASFLQGNTTLLIGEALRARNIGDEYLIKQYDFSGNRELFSFRVPAGKNFDLLIFSPDRKYVAADSPNGNLCLWEVNSGRLVAEFRGHQKALTAMAFSPDGKRLVSGDFDGMLKIWDIASGTEAVTFKQFRKWINGVSFSPDGRYLATTDESSTVRLWDALTGREIRSFIIPEASIVRVSFSPDAKGLVVSSKDGRVHLIDLFSGQIPIILAGHTREATAIVFSPDGKMLATGSVDRTAQIWDSVTGENLLTIRGHGSSVNALAWSTDARRLVTGSFDGAIKIWDVNAGPELPLLKSPVAKYFAAIFLPGHQILALGITREKEPRVITWDVSTGQEIAQYGEAGGNILCAVFSRDGKWLATGGMDHAIKLWNVTTGKLIHILQGHADNVYSLDFSPGGAHLISGSGDHTIRLWDVASGRELASLNNGVENYYRAIFSPDGRMIASACRDGTVKIWDTANLSVLKTLSGHTDKVRAIAFSPDGRLLATGGKDNTIRLWDVATGRQAKKLGQADYIQRAAFSKDGLRLVTGGVDGTVKLWDIGTQQELMILKRHAGEVSCVTFSTDGRDLVTTGTDGVIRLWRSASLSQ